MTTLGTGDYIVEARLRSGRKTVGTFSGLNALSYGRTLDGISQAGITVPTADCCELVADLHTWGHELVVWRNGKRAWEGPITNINIGRNTAILTAKDVTAWLAKRWPATAYPGAGLVTDVASTAISKALTPDDPGVLEFVQQFHDSSEISVTQPVGPYASTWLDYINNLAQLGLDFCAVGRVILLMPTFHDLGRAGIIYDTDVLGDISVIEDGDAAETQTQITDGGTLLASLGGVDDFYGLLENVTDTSNAGISDSDAAIYAQTRRNQLYPAPTIIYVPEQSAIRSASNVDFDKLVPGSTLTVVIDGCRPLRQVQRLSSLQVDVGQGVESVKVTLTPVGLS